MNNEIEKEYFLSELKKFTNSLSDKITVDGEWTIRGFIDIFRNIYTLPQDTKVVSKILELHLFPYFLDFAKRIDFDIEIPKHQNWYPDLTFIKRQNNDIKFAVDLKTTYRNENRPGYCNGFTLGSHGEYFIDRTSSKNVQFPYGSYSGHFCFGIIYSKSDIKDRSETSVYSIESVNKIPSSIYDFIFFIEEKWKIASDTSGSGNTANIGSIKRIDDILTGNGVFAKAGEKLFDDYWANYGKIEILQTATGKRKKLSSFLEYLRFRGFPEDLYNKGSDKKKLEA